MSDYDLHLDERAGLEAVKDSWVPRRCIICNDPDTLMIQSSRDTYWICRSCSENMLDKARSFETYSLPASKRYLKYKEQAIEAYRNSRTRPSGIWE